MIQIEEKEDEIYMIGTGKLDDPYYDKMLPLLKEKIEKHDKINCYFQMKDFKGRTSHAFGRDVKFDLKIVGKLSKVDIVGKKKWHELMTDTAKLFMDAYIRCFDETEIGDAREWISNRKV
jgi:hypothetical protein